MIHPKSKSLRRLLLTSLLLVIFTLSARSQERGMTPEMVVNLKRVSEVALDPNGQKVAFVLRVPRNENDKPGGLLF